MMPGSGPHVKRLVKDFTFSDRGLSEPYFSDRLMGLSRLRLRTRAGIDAYRRISVALVCARFALGSVSGAKTKKRRLGGLRSFSEQS
jgi:hypothetical protein